MAIYVCYVHTPTQRTPHLSSLEFETWAAFPQAIEGLKRQWPNAFAVELYNDGGKLLTLVLDEARTKATSHHDAAPSGRLH